MFTRCRQYEPGCQTSRFAKLPPVLKGGDRVDRDAERGDDRFGKDKVHQQIVERSSNLKKTLFEFDSLAAVNFTNILQAAFLPIPF